MERFAALDKWCVTVDSISKFFEQELDLSELFRPDVFLNSLRQHAAREARISMDGLKLVCSFSGQMRGVNLNVRVCGLQIEGCNFDGSKLVECIEKSPTVMSLPPCFIGWIQKVNFKKNQFEFWNNLKFEYEIGCVDALWRTKSNFPASLLQQHERKDYYSFRRSVWRRSQEVAANGRSYNNETNLISATT